MGERKVLNRYIPPDFDPSLLEGKVKRDRTKMMEIRMMLPFSLRCNTCGEYMYQGKKFNSKKEDLNNERYMGIRKIRFYIKCSSCSAEITFKTDPKNADYECESGASRNFEMWRSNAVTSEEDAKAREAEEANDAMKALENKTMDNKMEMDVLDALDEIKAINQRHNRVSTEKVLQAIHKKQDSKSSEADLLALNAEDEALIRSIKFKSNIPTISRVEDGDEEDAGLRTLAHEDVASQITCHLVKPANTVPNVSVMIKKKRKIDIANSRSGVEESSKKALVETAKEVTTGSIAISRQTSSSGVGALFDYEDDEE
jgi:hypothetical protein